MFLPWSLHDTDAVAVGWAIIHFIDPYLHSPPIPSVLIDNKYSLFPYHVSVGWSADATPYISGLKGSPIVPQRLQHHQQLAVQIVVQRNVKSSFFNHKFDLPKVASVAFYLSTPCPSPDTIFI